MTTVARPDRAAAPQARVRGHALDASAFLVVYCVLLLLVPSRLIVYSLGAAGYPAALWGIIGLIWWGVARLGRLVPRERSPVRLAFVLFACAVLASYAAAMAKGWWAPGDIHQSTDNVYDLILPTADQVQAKMISAANRGLLALASWLGVALVAIDGLRSRESLDRVVTWLVRLATIVAFVGIVQFFTGWNVAASIHIPGLSVNGDYAGVIDRSVLRRATSTAIHPIEFGVVMGGILPLALHRGIQAHPRLLAWVPPALIGAAAMMSVSRSAVLVIGVSFIVMFTAWPRPWRRRALWIGPLSLIVLRVLVPGLVGTMRSLWTNLFLDPSTTGRTADYGPVFYLVGRDPVFGRGMFTFIPEYYRTLDNQILDSLLELGVVGLTVLVGLYAVAYFCARGVRLRGPTPGWGHLGTALAGSLVGLFVSFATFDAFTFPMAAGTSFLMVGLAGAAWQIAVREVGR